MSALTAESGKEEQNEAIEQVLVAVVGVIVVTVLGEVAEHTEP